MAMAPGGSERGAEQRLTPECPEVSHRSGETEELSTVALRAVVFCIRRLLYESLPHVLQDSFIADLVVGLRI